jgi:hypothetical protein
MKSLISGGEMLSDGLTIAISGSTRRLRPTSRFFCGQPESSDHKLRVWLDRFRKRLVERFSGISASGHWKPELGSRLDSSRSPEGFEQLVYGKGAWVFHMLREMLREPGAKNPDAALWVSFAPYRQYAYRAFAGDCSARLKL